jgi:hypothetical protein
MRRVVLLVVAVALRSPAFTECAKNRKMFLDLLAPRR